mmetsp:Transcript_100560/g.322785  ORF Transcript_100560/g.322785 Transcript_100560/m.322785 type:complete len:219 (-) Transcript_100560:952-1608(-)
MLSSARRPPTHKKIPDLSPLNRFEAARLMSAGAMPTKTGCLDGAIKNLSVNSKRCGHGAANNAPPLQSRTVNSSTSDNTAFGVHASILNRPHGSTDLASGSSPCSLPTPAASSAPSATTTTAAAATTSARAAPATAMQLRWPSALPGCPTEDALAGDAGSAGTSAKCSFSSRRSISACLSTYFSRKRPLFPKPCAGALAVRLRNRCSAPSVNPTGSAA